MYIYDNEEGELISMSIKMFSTKFEYIKLILLAVLFYFSHLITGSITVSIDGLNTSRRNYCVGEHLSLSCHLPSINRFYWSINLITIITVSNLIPRSVHSSGVYATFDEIGRSTLHYKFSRTAAYSGLGIVHLECTDRASYLVSTDIDFTCKFQYKGKCLF